MPQRSSAQALARDFFLVTFLWMVQLSSRAAQAQECSSEQQVVQCGQLPVSNKDEQQVFLACCQFYKPPRLPSPVKATAAAAVNLAAQPPRPDLNLTSGPWSNAPNFFYSPTCPNIVRFRPAVPVFSGNTVRLQRYSAPLLAKATIQRVKAAAITRLTGTRRSIRLEHNRIRSVNNISGFVHPAGQVGPAELAVLSHRAPSPDSLTAVALQNMIFGEGVPKKVYGTWWPYTNTSIDYEGPFAAPKVVVLYGGAATSDPGSCPSNYPVGAPRAICGHISLVELDGQQSYKHALAFLATKDTRYAQVVLRIINGWATINKEITPVSQNAPLEAAWAISSMSKALELLRGRVEEWPQSVALFRAWVDSVMMPAMDTYIDQISWNAIQKVPNIYGNWHSSIAEAYMAYALLTDDASRFRKAVSLFQNTTADYLRWGKGADAAGRVLGECSETLRDIYHSEFGMGGLIQVAEMAWQQDMDLYSASDFALASMMELHARIINAWDANKDESLLPLGFRWFENMVAAPPGTQWRFNMTSQRWFAMNTTTFAKVSDYPTDTKWLLGVKYLPTGWEIGFNHYVGRLGIKLPETAALLSRYNPDWYEFHWGLGTLTTADTATLLWRSGVFKSTMCG